MIRLLDIFVSLISLLLFLPILLIIPILIKLDDQGPVFFHQQRLGKNKRPLTVWKFRTMQDDKITRIGKWLRSCALDEFLQFLLILKGDISLVGPRPLTQSDVDRLGWDTAEYQHRWQIRPGLTGLVQIYGGTSAEHSWQLEQTYLNNKSLITDLKIILLSACVTLIGKRRTKQKFPWKIVE